jgi:O-antigen/teichoic acid export membrane protein
VRESSLFKNTWLNLLGQGLPLVLAFLVLPWLIHTIGDARMGVLTTIWVVIGDFVLLDLGLGRAVVHIVAERTAQGARDEVPDYIWPALFVIGTLSIVGGLIVAVLSPEIVHLLVKVSEELRPEAESAFFAVSLSLPLVTLTSCLRGILEARQKFVGANLLQGLSTGANVLVPVATALSTPSLATMAWALFWARSVLLIVHFIMALREFPELKRAPRLSRGSLTRLFHFGTWSTVTNVVGPVMVYLDRLVVGSRVDASAVPIYAIPHEAVTRFLIIPAALARALFPRMSSLTHDVRVDLYRRVVGVMTLAIFPGVAVAIYFADEALRLWLGASLGASAAPIFKILVLGYFFNATAHIPFIQLQSLERPDLSAKIHLVELPVYLAGLFYLTNLYGALGAASAWLLRVSFDAVCMFWTTNKLHRNAGLVSETWGIAVGGCLLVPAFFPLAIWLRALLCLLAIAVCTVLSWRFWFDSETRVWILRKTGRAV